MATYFQDPEKRLTSMLSLHKLTVLQHKQDSTGHIQFCNATLHKMFLSKCPQDDLRASSCPSFLKEASQCRSSKSLGKISYQHTLRAQLKLVFCKCLLGISKALTWRGQEPPSMPAWMATPVTTARSGSTDVLGSFPKNS